MAIADSAHALEITGHGCDRAQSGANHGFGNEGNDVIAAKLFDLGFELLGQAFAIGLGRLAGAQAAIFVDW